MVEALMCTCPYAATTRCIRHLSGHVWIPHWARPWTCPARQTLCCSPLTWRPSPRWRHAALDLMRPPAQQAHRRPSASTPAAWSETRVGPPMHGCRYATISDLETYVCLQSEQDRPQKLQLLTTHEAALQVSDLALLLNRCVRRAHCNWWQSTG